MYVIRDNDVYATINQLKLNPAEMAEKGKNKNISALSLTHKICDIILLFIFFIK